MTQASCWANPVLFWLKWIDLCQHKPTSNTDRKKEFEGVHLYKYIYVRISECKAIHDEARYIYV